MGVRNAQDAPIATAMRKGSDFTASCVAVLSAIGHIMAAVAALLMKLDRTMVKTKIVVNPMTACPCARFSNYSRAT